MILLVRDTSIPLAGEDWELSGTVGDAVNSTVTRSTFTIIVERDLDTGSVIGSVVELPGCVSEARDSLALIRNMREAIASYREAGGIPQPPETAYYATWRVEVID